MAVNENQIYLYIQALLGVKVEPKEAPEEVKKEEGLESLRWGLAVEESDSSASPAAGPRPSRGRSRWLWGGACNGT